MTPMDFDIAHEWNFAFGEDTAAQGTHVMVRIAREGVILVEERMPPEEFLNLAHAFENVARGVQAHLDKPAHVPEHVTVPKRRPNKRLSNPIYESST